MAVGTLATLVEGRIDSEGGSVHRFIKTKTSALLSIQSPDCAPKQAAAGPLRRSCDEAKKSSHYAYMAPKGPPKEVETQN